MRRSVRTPFLLMVLFIITALLAQACTAPASAPGAIEAPPASEESAAPTEAAPVEEEAEDEAVTTVQQSEVSQSQLVGGVSVTTDEDVTIPRDPDKFGGEYRSSTTSDFVSFHPYLTTDTASSAAQANVYDGALLRLHEDTLQFIPHMAKSYSVSEDGLTYTFTLHDSLEWSDGTPLTAYDFEWTWEQVIKPENEFPYLSNMSDIASYQALDEHTLEIVIKEAYCPALTVVASAITPLPKHIWETLDWKDPETNPEINNPSVTSGPYQLEERQRDQYTVYTANENYWYHGAPSIERSIIEIVPDPDISYQKMVSGETDTGVILPDKLEEARQLENVTVYEWWPARAAWTYIGLNMRRPDAPTADVNVRRGIAYAIDKDVITEEIMEGQAKRQCSAYPDSSWAYNPDVPCYDYNTEAALAEFAKAGYTFENGTMLSPEGEPVKLQLIFGPNTNRVRELIAVTVQDNLAAIGIEVEIQAMEWATFLEATDSPDGWDMFIGGWSSTIEPQFMDQIWSEENIPQLNSVGYINKEVENLFKEAGQNCAVDYRKEKFGEIQRILAEDAPYVFLYYSKTWSGQNNRIGGIEPKPVGIGWNSLDWYIRADAGQ